MKQTFVVIPTYNESENIRQLIQDILDLNIKNLQIVVVDDDSPDGTWKIVEEMKKENELVHLLRRTKKKGRGTAGVAGFKYAVAHDADYILEMDADFSHNPRYIPAFLEKMKEADVVIGSRGVSGGRDVGRNPVRQVITKLANMYIRTIFGVKVRDCNSGYRCFKREVIEAIDLDRTISDGPAIVQEWLYKTHLNGFMIKEVPIVFMERQLGKSKLKVKGLYKGYIMVLKLKFLHIIRKL
jgi:dolichol-phosphate mannosyltransferase